MSPSNPFVFACITPHGLRISEQFAITDCERLVEEDAKPDGIWQALVLAGAIPQEARDVEFLSSEIPTYFGLMCAAYYNR